MNVLSLKEATLKAIEFFQELFPDALNIRLEEVEPRENGGWIITLSYSLANTGTLQSILRNREYKIITVNVENEIESIKMRIIRD